VVVFRNFPARVVVFRNFPARVVVFSFIVLHLLHAVMEILTRRKVV
jgi:hypothetical protein